MRFADPAQGEKTLKRLKAATAGMGADYTGSWRAHHAEVARYTQPRLGSALGNLQGSQQRKGDQVNNKLLDGKGMQASGVLARGMARGMANPSTPWFKLTVKDRELRKDAAVKAWLADVEQRLYDYFSSTNFYNTVKAAYLHLAVFGTGAMLMVPSDKTIGVSYSLPMGSYHLALDHELNVNRMARAVDMTVIQLYERFYPHNGDAAFPQRVRDAYRRGDYGITEAVNHYIEPNGDAVWGRMDAMSKPFRSYHWLANHENCKLLDVGGYDEQPFMAPRWDVEGVDVWGRGPGMDALPALRQLQLDAMRKQQAKDFLVKPPMVVPQNMANRQIALFPGSIISSTLNGEKGIGPAFEVPAQALGVLAQDVMDTRQEVDTYFFADLFMAITNMDGVQPRNIEEIASRNEEKLTQLGPVIDRNQNELLRPAIDRAYGILERVGEIPPIPEALADAELDYEFVGILAQMQKAIGVGSIERGLGFVGNLIAVYPEAKDKIDIDEVIDEYMERIGTPPRMIRSNDAVAEIRNQRAQQEQMANMAGGAQPAAQAAQAAKLMSETDTGEGASLLQRLIGA